MSAYGIYRQISKQIFPRYPGVARSNERGKAPIASARHARQQPTPWPGHCPRATQPHAPSDDGILLSRRCLMWITTNTLSSLVEEAWVSQGHWFLHWLGSELRMI